jgi:nitrogen fixation-related uncharacterized protein
MRRSLSAETDMKHVRRRGWSIVIVALFALAVLAGALALFGVAYVRQSARVDDLKDQNEQILGDHQAIGQKFAKQSERFEQQTRKLEAALRSSYKQGFAAGTRTLGLPPALRPLARYAAVGMLIPRRIPPELDPKEPDIRGAVDGYVIRWRGLALFASRTDPLRVWTRQALGGLIRPVTLGSHRVKRLTGPTGVIYAWRQGASTYALLALPQLEDAGREIVASMR